MGNRDAGNSATWLSLLDFFVSIEQATAMVAVFAWVFGGAIVLARFKRRLQLRMASVESPYFLSRRRDLGQPFARFKKQYVDPFE